MNCKEYINKLRWNIGWYRRRFYYRYVWQIFMWYRHREIFARIKKTQTVHVAFIASSLAMWRYQGIYELLRKDSRFVITIIVAPFLPYSREQQRKCTSELLEYFGNQGQSCVNMLEILAVQSSPIDQLGIDLIFYPQHYYKIIDDRIDSSRYINRKLIAYIPYSFITVNADWANNTEFQNKVWKIFHQTTLHKQWAKNNTFCKGNNVIVVGEPNADFYQSPSLGDPWKKQLTKKKRIIWAPHYTIGKSDLLHRGSFLWISEFMKSIAIKYEGEVQIAFKPHPRLKTELYVHEDWGKVKTDDYYNFWEKQSNTQLESGAFGDLFMKSDAMIHDCGSFTAEFLYINKPVMFVTKNVSAIKSELNNIGKKCLDMHYLGATISQIEEFVISIVINGEDKFRKKRQDFINEYLLPPNKQKVSYNIYSELTSSLGLRKITNIRDKNL